MRYTVDHDFHIHSVLSGCCHDPNQTSEEIYDYAERNHFRKICLTNHFWDEKVPPIVDGVKKDNFAHISECLPLPNYGNARFCFGAETDMDKNFTLGISRERFDELDFVAIPTTHLHLSGFTIDENIDSPEDRANLWIARFRKLLSMDLPWHKIGIAHLTCGHIVKHGSVADVFHYISDDIMYELFSDCATKGVGIELNMKAVALVGDEGRILLNPYYIAKDCGCKFYLGSDSHKVDALRGAKENFENIVTMLDLKESDKFDF